MKALNWPSDRKLEMTTMPAPEIGEKDVLIAVEATGICGSDLHAYLGQHRFRRAPAVLGHEVVGRVEQKGDQVKGLEIGDRVTVMPLIACGVCSQCRSGRNHLCSNKVVPGTPKWTGTFADYFVAPEGVTLKLPESFPVELGVLMEPLAVAVHAVRQAGTIAGARVRVLGAGPIGHLIGLAARSTGAHSIHCVDPDPTALAVADRNGFETSHPGDSSEFEPASVTFVTANHAASLDDAFAGTESSGTVVVVSMYEGQIPVDIYQLVFHEFTVRGSMLYSLDDFDEAVRVAAENETELSRVVTPLMPLEEGPAEFERIARGERAALKSLLSPSSSR